MELKRIETKEAREKKHRINQTIIGVILVAIMLLSTLGYAVVNEQRAEKVNYQGFSFVRVQGGWAVEKQAFSLVTRYLPLDVENIPSNSISKANDFVNKQLYLVAFSSNEKFAAAEIVSNLPILRAQYVCLESEQNRTECADFPIKNCFDDKILIIKELNVEKKDSNETNQTNVSSESSPVLSSLENATIYKQNKCNIIEADSESLLKAADRFLFQNYDIIK